MSGNPETFEFRSEARQLLDLMIHSLYTHKEVFLRELISNASDALDKLRFEAVKDTSLVQDDRPLSVRITVDPDARTLTIDDNGIGMTREEVVSNLGTIARSGTREFAEQLQAARGAEGDETDAATAALIGQFGVGFYSAFMVADSVTVVTRRAGEDASTRWHSTGDGTFSVEDAERETFGTAVTLHLRPVDEENDVQDFSADWMLRQTIRKYSDFVQYPIQLQKTETVPVEADAGAEEDAEAGDDEAAEAPEPETRTVWDTVNSMKAIWTRPQSEVTDEEYAEFYKHISHDWSDPLSTITLRAEGSLEYRALLFVPENPPFDLFYRDAKAGLTLYSQRVLIMEQCEALLPVYLRFVKGVVDSADLALNVSREMLQEDRRLTAMRKRIVKKVLDQLASLHEKEPEKYASFWSGFGRVIKEGVTTDPDNFDRIVKLLRFQTTDESGETTLAGYVERMKDGQDAIYYISGESKAAVERSPHLEAFRAKGYEVLLMTDPVDEIMLGRLTEFEGTPLKSAGKGDVELGTDEEKKEAEEARKEKEATYGSLLERIQKDLDAHIKQVRLSSRLTDSPACLVNDEEDLSPHFERLLKRAGQGEGLPTSKRILELNPDHEILARMQTRFDADAEDAVLADYATLLFGQALLAEGSPLPDPVEFSQKVASLMVRAG